MYTLQCITYGYAKNNLRMIIIILSTSGYYRISHYTNAKSPLTGRGSLPLPAIRKHMERWDFDRAIQPESGSRDLSLPLSQLSPSDVCAPNIS